MAAPEYVPPKPAQQVRSYESPPRRPEPWMPGRPGELLRQPRGEMLGSPGPDQGYIYVLARQFQGKLRLTDGEHEADALAGGSAIALKRASLFGRAPVVHDLRVALVVWGFLGEGDAPAAQVTARKALFAEVANPHHWAELRRVVDVVPDETLRLTPAQATAAVAGDWRSLVRL